MKEKDSISSVYIGSDKVTQYLNISLPFLYKLIKINKIPHYRLGAKYLFKTNEIDNFIQKTKNEKE
jgi:excisionase family DNA binding protein